MILMSEYVGEEVCAERHKVVDERFSRDKQDIEEIKKGLEDKDERLRRIETLTVEMGEMLKNHDRILADHDKRLETLESKPGKLWDTLVTEIIKLLASGAVGALLAYLTIKP